MSTTGHHLLFSLTLKLELNNKQDRQTWISVLLNHCRNYGKLSYPIELATSWAPNPKASHTTVTPINPYPMYSLWTPRLSSRALNVSPTWSSVLKAKTLWRIKNLPRPSDEEICSISLSMWKLQMTLLVRVSVNVWNYEKLWILDIQPLVLNPNAMTW